jgi:steroid delta-isomerase-like uncharacterized protein
MSVEVNKEILHRFFRELFSEGNLDVADEIVGLNYVNHNAMPGEMPGREGLKGFASVLRSAFPDLQFTFEHQLADEDKVVTRWIAEGTHQGEFLGIPATNRSLSITGTNIHLVSGGKIQEAWQDWDALGLMQQLSVIPEIL